MDIEALERREIRKRQVTVGLLFASAVVLAIIFASWMGLWGIGRSNVVYVRYNFAGGIDSGSPVRLAGIRIGRVREIQFDSVGEGVLRIKLEIQRSAFKQITNDSGFYINLAGLIGERYVEIVPGKGTAIRNGDELRGIDPPRIDQLISQGYGIFGDLRDFFQENRADLKEMFFTLNDLSKNLNRLMNSASSDQRRQLSTLLTNFAAMSSDMRVTLSTLKEGMLYAQKHGADSAWLNFRNLLDKGDKITVQDLRRLMLEDGVKVNFSSRKVSAEILNNGDKQ